MSNNAYLAKPNSMAYSNEFDYSVWVPGTHIRLCNVPWTSDYRDIVNFSNDKAAYDYVDSIPGPSLQLDRMTYAVFGAPIRLNIPFNTANQYNYIRVSNPMHRTSEDRPMTFYYFVSDITYVAPNTTQINVQVDVWTTYSRSVKFGNCYIERGHVGIANQDNFKDYGRSYLTQPEGLDLGGEYEIFSSDETVVTKPTNTGNGASDYCVAVYSTVDLSSDWGTVTNPKMTMAKGSIADGLPNGMDVHVFESPIAFMYFMKLVSPYPWITQSIISIHALPRTFFLEMNYGMVFYPENDGVGYKNVKFDSDEWKNPPSGYVRAKTTPPFDSGQFDGKTSNSRLLNLSGNFRAGVVPEHRYRHLHKFKTYPYSFIEMTTYTGAPLVLKPELLNGDSVEVLQLHHLSVPSPRLMFLPIRYNNPRKFDSAHPNGREDAKRGEYLDYCTGITNFPTFAIPNNSYISFLASNQHSIAYQHNSAEWTQQRTMAGNELAFDQAQRNIGAMNQRTGIGANAALDQARIANQTGMNSAMISGAQSVLGGAMGGLGAMNPVLGVAGGAASGAISGAFGMGQQVNTNMGRDQSTAAANSAMMRTNSVNTGVAGYMADTNRAYANYAARGDYQNTIAGINARVQDATMIQPTVSGQVGGEAFNLVVDGWKLVTKVKRITPAVRRFVGDYWLRYGYAVNQFSSRPIELNVMSNFTYWKIRESYILSSTCPESFRQTIRGIFEKGVTVWSDPAKIGSIDISDNDPLPGVTL